MVLGHGPHQDRGIEIYEGKPIFYALGDFFLQNDTVLLMPHDNMVRQGLSWDQGYNYTPHPDERFILSKVTELRMPPVGDLGQLFDADKSSSNPKRFAYGSLPLYLLKIVELGYEFATNDRLHDLRLTGRILSSIADVSTVVLSLIHI